MGGRGQFDPEGLINIKTRVGLTEPKSRMCSPHLLEICLMRLELIKAILGFYQTCTEDAKSIASCL